MISQILIAETVIDGAVVGEYKVKIFDDMLEIYSQSDSATIKIEISQVRDFFSLVFDIWDSISEENDSTSWNPKLINLLPENFWLSKLDEFCFSLIDLSGNRIEFPIQDFETIRDFVIDHT